MASPFLRGFARSFSPLFAQAFAQGAAAAERRGIEERSRLEREAVREEERRRQRAQQMLELALKQADIQQGLLNTLLSSAIQMQDFETAGKIAQLAQTPLQERFAVKEVPTLGAIEAQKRLGAIGERVKGEAESQLARILPGITDPVQMAIAAAQTVTPTEVAIAQSPKRAEAFQRLQKQAKETKRVPVLKPLPLDQFKIKKRVDPLEKELKKARLNLLKKQAEALNKRLSQEKRNRAFNHLKTLVDDARQLIVKTDDELRRLTELQDKFAEQEKEIVQGLTLGMITEDEAQAQLNNINNKKSFLKNRIISLSERLAELEAAHNRARAKMQEIAGVDIEEPIVDDKKDREFRQAYAKARAEGLSEVEAQARAIKEITDKYPDLLNIQRMKTLRQKAMDILGAKKEPEKKDETVKEKPDNKKNKTDEELVTKRFREMLQRGLSTSTIRRTLVEEGFDVKVINRVGEKIIKEARRKASMAPK